MTGTEPQAHMLAAAHLLQLHRMHKYIAITLTPGQNKADLSESRTMQLLLRAKEN